MKEEIEIALNRGKEFRENYNKDIVGEKISSGFWLTPKQLCQLALDLEKQKSKGIGFMVGCREDASISDSPIFSVEIVSLICPDAESHDRFNHDELGYFLDTDSKSKGYDSLTTKVKIHKVKNQRGFIETSIKILHSNINSSEGQRFPPPFPED